MSLQSQQQQELQPTNEDLAAQQEIYDNILEFTESAGASGTSSLIWQLISNFR
jgi:hypothetical protein